MQFIQALPYMLTVVLLAGFIGKRRGAQGERRALREGTLTGSGGVIEFDPMTTELADPGLYERDFYLWTQQQAAELRHARGAAYER